MRIRTASIAVVVAAWSLVACAQSADVRDTGLASPTPTASEWPEPSQVIAACAPERVEDVRASTGEFDSPEAALESAGADPADYGRLAQEGTRVLYGLRADDGSTARIAELTVENARWSVSAFMQCR